MVKTRWCIPLSILIIGCGKVVRTFWPFVLLSLYTLIFIAPPPFLFLLSGLHYLVGPKSTFKILLPHRSQPYHAIFPGICNSMHAVLLA